MSHQSEQMPEDMAICLWLQSLNDELNEALARDGRDDVTDLLQQRYSILKRLAIASVKRELLNIPEGWKLVPIVPTEEMKERGFRASSTSPSPEEMQGIWEWMIEEAPPPPITDSLSTDSGEDGDG